MSLDAAHRGGYEGRPGWWLRVSYDPDMVSGLKATVPARCRAWDAEAGQWWVAEDWAEALLPLLPALEAHLRQAPLF